MKTAFVTICDGFVEIRFYDGNRMVNEIKTANSAFAVKIIVSSAEKG